MTTIDPDMLMTVLAQIPQGKVASYGQIAALVGAPAHARMVGRMLSRLPQGSGIPWHRVTNAQGVLTCPGRDEAQRRLLNEGVEVVNYRVSLSRYKWQPGASQQAGHATGQ